MAKIISTRNPGHGSKLMFLMFSGAIGIILLVIGGYQLVEFMDSTAFCGQLCHEVMYPEYTTYQASPHSRITCSECHVGSGASYLVKSKISGAPMLVSVTLNNFHRPIPTPVENLRPARETCQECHRPERFAGDLVRTHTTYLTDEANTQKIDTRVLRVGGGEDETARDIHWHIAAEVWYLALDDQRQEISWVSVENNDGILVEYIDPEKSAEINPQRIENEKRLMDCLDCHNRATHIFQSPEQLIDGALLQGKIDGSLPFIKKLGLNALDPPNSSLSEAISKVEAISDYYRNSYSDVYMDKLEAINKALQELKEIARLTTFPEMNVSWKTYPDNIAHQESPGCFRCHGKLVSENDSPKSTVIDADCNLCHYFEL